MPDVSRQAWSAAQRGLRTARLALRYFQCRRRAWRGPVGTWLGKLVPFALVGGMLVVLGVGNYRAQRLDQDAVSPSSPSGPMTESPSEQSGPLAGAPPSWARDVQAIPEAAAAPRLPDLGFRDLPDLAAPAPRQAVPGNRAVPDGGPSLSTDLRPAACLLAAASVALAATAVRRRQRATRPQATTALAEDIDTSALEAEKQRRRGQGEADAQAIDAGVPSAGGSSPAGDVSTDAAGPERTGENVPPPDEPAPESFPAEEPDAEIASRPAAGDPVHEAAAPSRESSEGRSHAMGSRSRVVLFAKEDDPWGR